MFGSVHLKCLAQSLNISHRPTHIYVAILTEREGTKSNVKRGVEWRRGGKMKERRVGGNNCMIAKSIKYMSFHPISAWQERFLSAMWRNSSIDFLGLKINIKYKQWELKNHGTGSQH